jgi:hypothetical protein
MGARGSGSDDAVSSGPNRPGAPARIRLVSPRPGLRDLRAAAIDRHRIGRNGRRLTVFFWSGPPPCERLADVDLRRVEGRVEVTVHTGTDPASAGSVCPELAVLLGTRIVLDEDLVGRPVTYGGP